MWFLRNERRFIGKIWKTYFSGEIIFGGQNPKNGNNLLKNFIVPKRLLGHNWPHQLRNKKS